MKKIVLSLILLSLFFWLVFWLFWKQDTKQNNLIIDNQEEVSLWWFDEQKPFYEEVLMTDKEQSIIRERGSLSIMGDQIFIAVSGFDLMKTNLLSGYQGFSFSQNQNGFTLNLYGEMYDEALIAEGMTISNFSPATEKQYVGLVKEKWSSIWSYIQMSNNDSFWKYKKEDISSESSSCSWFSWCLDVLYIDEMFYRDDPKHSGIHNGYFLSRLIDFGGTGYLIELRSTQSLDEAKKQILSYSLFGGK